MGPPHSTEAFWDDGSAGAAALEQATDGFVACNPDLRIVFLNSAAERLYGKARAEVTGSAPWEAACGCEGDLERECRRVMAERTPATLEYRHGASGARVEARVSPAAWGGIFIWFRDVSERKQLQDALQQKIGELNEVQRLAGVGSWTWDMERDAVAWSDELHRLAGSDPTQVQAGRKGFERFHTPESFARLQLAAEKACADGKPVEVDVEAILPDGRRCWRVIRAEAQRDGSGRIVGLRGTAQDITARRQAEEQLRSAHAELTAIHAHAPMLFLVVDEDLRVRKLNEAAVQFAGRPAADVLGLRPGGSLGCLNSLQDPRGCGYGSECGTCPLRLAVLDTVRNQVRHDDVEAWLPAGGPEGVGERCFLAFTAPLQLAGVNQALICALDITERKRAEQALRDSEYWLRESQRVSRIGSYVLDCATGTWKNSETLDDIFGIGADYPRTVEGWLDLVHPEHREEMLNHFAREVMEQGKPFDREYRIVRRDGGQARWVHGRGAVVRDAAGVPLAMTGTIQDIEARRAVEEDLRQAQKLEGLGRLAGGIAHDFNNLLTVINGYADMLLGELRNEDPLRDAVGEISRAGQRAANLTAQLLAFSRKQMIAPQLLDLNALIGEHLSMLRRLAGEDIELETRLAGPSAWVMADPGQMHQVLMNLVANARDAMPRGGRLTIATSERQSAAGDPHRPASLEPGNYVMISVEDTGTGIAAGVREHIFDPFFTTKGRAEGAGLGLATVHAIVRQAGGAITFDSEPGRGTTFLIHLPRAESSAVALPAPAPSPSELRGTETVLVVEDQASVRKLVVGILRQHGYQILEAAQGEEALKAAEAHRGPIHLLLTDVVMPGMTGRELARRLRVARSSMRVLYMSGYAEDIVAGRGLLDQGVPYIAKPFAPEVLALSLREALGAAPAADGARILVVDDEGGVRTFLQKVLDGAGYRVLVAENGAQALAMVRAGHFDLVLTDLVMPEKEGIETIRSMRKDLPGLKIVAMSGAFGGEFLAVARHLGANATLTKPVAPEQLLATVREVLG